MSDIIKTSEENVAQTELSAEQLAENERAYNSALNKLLSYNLNWTFRSINYILNSERTSFGQLRSCVYMQDGQGVFDYIKSTILLVKAGLVGSKQIAESDSERLEDRAYEIIEDWRNNIGFIGTLHLLIINLMEERHFFIRETDRQIVSHLSSKNLQTELTKNLVMEDLEERIRQAQALTQQMI